MVVAGIVGAGALRLCFSVLTGVGEHSRGAPARVVLLAGLLFPITCLVWYLKDEEPFHRPARRPA